MERDFINLLPAALMLLWPIGFMLLSSSAAPEAQAPAVAVNLLMTWAIAALAYFAVGFAFHFGGIAQVSANPDLGGLYWEWYPLDQSVNAEAARLWGVIALQGWGLAGPAATPGALQLFAGHLALVGLAAMIPISALLQHARRGISVLASLLIGAIIYPIGGNWVWGGGWLSHLGASLGLGHGLIDFGGASMIFLAGSMVVLVVLVSFRPSQAEDNRDEPDEVVISIATNNPLTVYGEPNPSEPEEVLQATPMPSAYLPILGLLGAGLMLLGWFGLAAGSHIPSAINFSPAQAGVNGLLSALGAAFTAAAYSWFATRAFDPLMTARGVMAGLVVATAGAPFMPAWLLVGVGLVMGLLLPLLIYLFNQGLPLTDELGTLATYGVSALLSLLLVALFADGRAGQGWNGIGPAEAQAGAEQGVSGLLVAPGFVADWPGQLQAQLLGMGAIALLAVGVTLLLFQTIKVVTQSWASTGLEFAPPTLSSAGSSPPAPVSSQPQVEAREKGSEDAGGKSDASPITN